VNQRTNECHNVLRQITGTTVIKIQVRHITQTQQTGNYSNVVRRKKKQESSIEKPARDRDERTRSLRCRESCRLDWWRRWSRPVSATQPTDVNTSILSASIYSYYEVCPTSGWPRGPGKEPWPHRRWNGACWI